MRRETYESGIDDTRVVSVSSNSLQEVGEVKRDKPHTSYDGVSHSTGRIKYRAGFRLPPTSYAVNRNPQWVSGQQTPRMEYIQGE
jgi:hypothetical protein